MPQLRLALAQINVKVGDLIGNSHIIVQWARKANQEAAHLVVFPEMALTGYPVEDLVLRQSFAQASQSALTRLAGMLAEGGCAQLAVVVGYLDRDERGARNAAAVLYQGKVVARQYKYHLPNYGVFDERRYFHLGDCLAVFQLHGLDIGMVICEDLWQDGGPIAGLAEVGVDLVVSPNASPYERHKDDTRLPLVLRRASQAGAPLAYVNMVGGQDELVFDGDSMVVDSAGNLLTRSAQFVENLTIIDLDLPGSATKIPDQQLKKSELTYAQGFSITRHILSADPVTNYPVLPYPPAAPSLSDEAEMWHALVTSLRDYTLKNGFRSVIVGLSGGIDSSVVAALAVDALGPDAVYGISMPSRYSSTHSLDDARELADRTGLHYSVTPIDAMVTQFVTPLNLSGLAEENAQARARGIILMSLSNQHGHLVLAPGNKTELAVGYSTLYGDSVGGFAPIKDVFKTQVWQLAHWRNAEAVRAGQVAPIPENSIQKPPSAELRPGQLDTDSLPDYPILDAILTRYIEGDFGYHDLVEQGFAVELIDQVLWLVDRAEYKRRQYPPGTKISAKAFGRDRRLPITNGWREHQSF